MAAATSKRDFSGSSYLGRLIAFCRSAPHVVELDTRLDAIEQSWCHRQKPLSCITVGHGAYVSVHAKYLLQHNQPGARLARRADDLGTHVLAVFAL